MNHVLPFVLISLTAPFMNSYAASISDPNVFNTGTQQAAVAASSAYNLGVFPLTGVDDLSGSSNQNQYFFEDGGVDNLLSLSSFSAPAGIDTIRIYDPQEYQLSRVANSVTIYTSTANQSSLTTADYTLLGTFNLPVGSNGFYTSGSDPAPTSNNYSFYDDLTGLNIASSTQSILFDFGHAGDIGSGVSEIQGFGAVPEPGTYSMLILGAGLLAFVSRFKKALL